MTWRGPRTHSDKMYTRAPWRAIRQHWIALRLPCAVCGCAIDYDHGRYLADGSLNKRSLVVGHIVARSVALARGWSVERTDSVANTRPECCACSNRTGAQLGNRMQRAKMIKGGVVKRQPQQKWVTSTRW